MVNLDKMKNLDLLDDGKDDPEDKLGSKNAVFNCSSCGEINQDEVYFKCNTCPSEELIYRDGIYVCPECLLPGDNFECMICGGNEIKLDFSEPSEE